MCLAQSAKPYIMMRLHHVVQQPYTGLEAGYQVPGRLESSGPLTILVLHPSAPPVAARRLCQSHFYVRQSQYVSKYTNSRILIALVTDEMLDHLLVSPQGVLKEQFVALDANTCCNLLWRQSAT